jgi:hypothetical protein
VHGGLFISYRAITWLLIVGLLILEWAMVRSLSSKTVTEFPGGRAEMAGYIAVVAAVIGWFLWALSSK